MKKRTGYIIVYVIVLLMLCGVSLVWAEQELPENAAQTETVTVTETAMVTETCTEWIKHEMETMYANAEARFRIETDHENFTAYCGYCVGYELQEAGIFHTLHSVNGNVSYYEFLGLEPEGTYSVRLWKGIRKGGKYNVEKVCRELDAENPDGHMTYTLLCFKVGADNDQGHTFGHVLMIYSVYDGMVYWGETRGTFVDTIEAFADFYRETDRQYHFNGAFVYTATEK